MKLHLGCGQCYLEGYENIDFPSSEHSVQTKSVADRTEDLTELRFGRENVTEVRLHHVFEHFSRATACALLASWNSWLVPDGIVHIEVPDFLSTAKAVLRRFAGAKARSVGFRHIFGSQEAHWAVHYEGYTGKRLAALLLRFGFKAAGIKQTRYLDTYNVTVIAKKTKALGKEECRKAAESYLSGFMVNDAESERSMHAVWMREYDEQIRKSFA